MGADGLSPLSPRVIDWSGFFPVVDIGFGVVIPTYFLITSLAFCVALVWLTRRAEAYGFSRNRAIDADLFLMIGGMIGARLFHIIFEEPGYYAAHPWRVFQLWRGGFVWYGGAIVGTACALGYLRLKREPLLPWLDVFAPVCALGYALGRVACLFTGCCYGRLVEIGSHTMMRHPTQIYAIVCESLTLALLLFLERHRREKRFNHLRAPGQIFFVWLSLHAVGRLFMEHFRGDPRGPEPWGLSLATWISLALLVLSLVCLRRGRV